MILFIYLLNTGCIIGLYNIPISKLVDLINVVLFIYSFSCYLKQRKKIKSFNFKVLEFFWVLFLVYYIIYLLSQPAHLTKFNLSIFNLRKVYPYLLFFYTITIVNSKRKMYQVLHYLLIFAFIGSIITIVQSIYGLKPLTNSTFYKLGYWPGNQMMIGRIARVNLPIVDMITFFLLIMVFYQLYLKKIKKDFLSVLFIIPVFINYARTMWLGLIFALLFLLYLLNIVRKKKISRLIFSIFLVFLIIFNSLFIFSLFFHKNVVNEIINRVLMTGPEVKYQLGSFGSRLISIDKGINQWRTNIWFGLGPFSIEDLNQTWLVDIGIFFPLVCIGLIGVGLQLSIIISSFFLGIKSNIRENISINIPLNVIFGFSLSAYVVQYFIAQTIFLPHIFSTLGLLSGLTIVLNYILNPIYNYKFSLTKMF